MQQTRPRRSTTRRRKENLTASQVVADQIKDRRDAYGMSQQELADKIGESQSTVARIESGRRTITVDDLLKIALALDTAPVHLLGAGFTGDYVPVTARVRLKPAVARAWIRGKQPVRATADSRRFLFMNIPADEAEELFSAARIRDWLETHLSLAELAIAGKAEAVDFDPKEEKARLEGLLARVDELASRESDREEMKNG